MGKTPKYSKSSNGNRSTSIRNQYKLDFQESESDFDEENGEESEDEHDVHEETEEQAIEQYEKTQELSQGEGKSDTEMAALEKEYADIRQEVQILTKLKNHNAEEIQKGESLKNQKFLWDNALEFRILLQKPFSNSNKLPINHTKSEFTIHSDDINTAYSDLLSTCENTLHSLCNLQEALIHNIPSIIPLENNASEITELDEWTRICEIRAKIGGFRDRSVNKWHKKTQVSTGSAAIQGRFETFNQDVSDQIAACMRDPSRKIKIMQQLRSAVGVFGSSTIVEDCVEEMMNMGDGDPELLDDSEFYHQLLKEFFENVDPKASETALYVANRLRKRKRKKVDRRASKSRKIRYNVHQKLVNFMAPRPFDLPPMAPALFANLFGLQNT